MYTTQSKENLSFGSLVKRYIEKNNISYQDLVKTIGYKSKTSISRIIQDATSYQIRAQFYKTFSEHYNLNQQEADAFQTALIASRMGASSQTLFSAYHRLFYNHQVQKDVLSPTYESVNGDKKGLLADLIRDHGQHAQSIDILLFGLCSPSFIRTLYALLDSLNCPFRIYHDLEGQIEEASYIRLLEETSSFLFDPRYIPSRQTSESVSARLDHHLLLHYNLGEGASLVDLFLLLKSDHFLYGEPMSDELFSIYRHFLKRRTAYIAPLKTHSMACPENEQIGSFLSAQKQYAKQEADCSIYVYQKSIDLILYSV